MSDVFEPGQIVIWQHGIAGPMQAQVVSPQPPDRVRILIRCKRRDGSSFERWVHPESLRPFTPLGAA